MSSNAVAAVVEIAAALITAAGAVGAALISLRGSRGDPVPLARPAPGSAQAVPDVRRVSRSVWLGISGLILWIVPIVGIFVIAPGLYSGIRDFAPERLRKWPAAGVILCCVALVLLVINSAVGAYQGAHGQLWYQR